MGSAPGPRWGSAPYDPRYKLALGAHHVVPHCLEKIAATGIAYWI